jgi:hypothetical protein
MKIQGGIDRRRARDMSLQQGRPPTQVPGYEPELFLGAGEYGEAWGGRRAKHRPTALELLHRVPAEDEVKDFLLVYIAQNNRRPPANWDGNIELASK